MPPATVAVGSLLAVVPLDRVRTAVLGIGGLVQPGQDYFALAAAGEHATSGVRSEEGDRPVWDRRLHRPPHDPNSEHPLTHRPGCLDPPVLGGLLVFEE